MGSNHFAGWLKKHVSMASSLGSLLTLCVSLSQSVAGQVRTVTFVLGCAT